MGEMFGSVRLFDWLYQHLKSANRQQTLKRYRQKYNIHPDAKLGQEICLEGEGQIIIGGGRTHFGSYCFLRAWQGYKIVIGKNCAIGNHVAIYTKLTKRSGDVIIGDNVVIGWGSFIRPGVTIGEGAVVGAGAVVLNDIPANTLACGVPAKVETFKGDDAKQ